MKMIRVSASTESRSGLQLRRNGLESRHEEIANGELGALRFRQERLDRVTQLSFPVVDNVVLHRDGPNLPQLPDGKEARIFLGPTPSLHGFVKSTMRAKMQTHVALLKADRIEIRAGTMRYNAARIRRRRSA